MDPIFVEKHPFFTPKKGIFTPKKHLPGASFLPKKGIQGVILPKKGGQGGHF
jgi:hypothetical protein